MGHASNAKKQGVSGKADFQKKNNFHNFCQACLDSNKTFLIPWQAFNGLMKVIGIQIYIPYLGWTKIIALYLETQEIVFVTLNSSIYIFCTVHLVLHPLEIAPTFVVAGGVFFLLLYPQRE